MPDMFEIGEMRAYRARIEATHAVDKYDFCNHLGPQSTISGENVHDGYFETCAKLGQVHGHIHYPDGSVTAYIVVTAAMHAVFPYIRGDMIELYQDHMGQWWSDRYSHDGWTARRRETGSRLVPVATTEAVPA